VNRPETGMGSPGMLIKDLEDVGNEFGCHDMNLLVPGLSSLASEVANTKTGANGVPASLF
jgi:hypothetical protein